MNTGRCAWNDICLCHIREEVKLMKSQRGILTSPSYPENYPNLADCVYIIALPALTFFKLELHSMDIDECTQSSCTSQCPWDYLEIRDGQSESSPLLNKLCGNSTRVVVSNQLFLRGVVIFVSVQTIVLSVRYRQPIFGR